MAIKRYRPLRATAELRDLHSEVSLAPEDFIYPYFVVEGEGVRESISTLPGVFRLSTDNVVADVADLMQYGITQVLLFGVIDDKEKDERGSAAYADNNLIARTVKALKAAYPSLIVMTDICLCEYTSHGHCGLLHNHDVDNDTTLPLLAQMAVTHALAGADFVAPSAMMDGQVDAIRKALDAVGSSTRIQGYSAKFASAFYGPFRDAAHSAPSFGDRKTYQMDYRAGSQALLEVAADIEEGADRIMVKPAMAYLDIIAKVAAAYPDVPLTAYQVSGEYAMLKAGAAAGFFDEHRIFTESLSAIKRAGAQYIISYYARDFFKNR